MCLCNKTLDETFRRIIRWDSGYAWSLCPCGAGTPPACGSLLLCMGRRWLHDHSKWVLQWWELAGCSNWKRKVWQSFPRAQTQGHPSTDFPRAQIHPQLRHGAPGHQAQSVRLSSAPLAVLIPSPLLSESVPTWLSKRLLAGRIPPRPSPPAHISVKQL